HVFAMPSYRETFGLVYIEALSQGLPIIYAVNESVDKMIDGVGESCDPFSITSIENAIQRILDNYDSYDLLKIDFGVFSWKNIAFRYIDIFQKTISTTNEN